MSRSYRKFPLFRDTLWGGSHSRSMKAGKRYGNRRARRITKMGLKKETDMKIPNGSYYKRLGISSYELYEYKHYQTKQDVIDEWNKEQIELLHGINTWRSKYLVEYSLEEAIVDWKKSYLNK